MREFLRGAMLLGQGFAWWRRRPGVMFLGLIPAAIVGAGMLAALVALGIALPSVTVAITPFAEDWPGIWATALRVTVGTALVGTTLVLLAVSFTALCLMIGEPFYNRIWLRIETDLDNHAPAADSGFWQGILDALSLLVRGIGVSIFAGLLGLVPAVGGVLGAIVGVTLTGWLLADELSSRALAARGIARRDRRAMLGAQRARALGFGVATQVCFLVPLGAVVTMPAAVAGSTLLARSLVTANPPTAGTLD
ncbi:CysZ protein [Microbacterium endophyticum]|uniref:CysZ protein n=1 Tax=Microbacterium endophyticum TaxID=1526412 RepID=A0A7W4YMR0_9MICO|nr:EI24 domain-containing protein [Microbacterium endophyticum]MBB2974921.1 CysZ protein [Microbacterium endophyticum]NIK37218.1 CysZ protein [Microbacterium endophyticum]